LFDHAPEAVHEVASVLDHVSVLLLPDCTVAGLALKLTVGAGVGPVSGGFPDVSSPEQAARTASAGAIQKVRGTNWPTAILLAGLIMASGDQ
jgi:hypothetical protein